jgi:hypothetical protein
LDILNVLAERRNPQSYVAGATPLNRGTARFSSDIDVFHDREEHVAAAAAQDAETLRSAGYRITWLRRDPAIHAAEISGDGASTRLEWVADSDYRFFPTVKDEVFGFVLHPIDLALNKVMAAAGRREVRDIVDLALIDEQILPLGSLIWAAVDKSPGFTPEGLIAEIRRNLHHPKPEWKNIAATPPIDPQRIVSYLRAALDQADEFVARMPTDKVGLLFLKHGKVVQPDPGRLDEYVTHAGCRGGQWPSDPAIQHAMLERYTR